MISSRVVLQSYLQGLRVLSGAETATLFVPPQPGRNGLLLHVGSAAPVPELEELGAAAVQCRQLEALAEQSDLAADRTLQFASAVENGAVLRIPARQDSPYEPAQPSGKRRRRADQGTDGAGGFLWVGLRFAEGAQPALSMDPTEVELVVPEAVAGGLWPWLLAVGGTLVWHERRVSELLDDAVTGLPGRLQFQDVLGRALMRSRELEAPMTLLLVNPDDFDAVNAEHGRAAGDRALGELGHLLGTTLRSTDAVARFGAAVFAAILPDTSLEEGAEVAAKLRRRVAGTRLLGDVQLGCSIGAAGMGPDDNYELLPNDLIRNASRALNAAKMSGGNSVVAWDEAREEIYSQSADRLSDIFTGDPVKDYRNMSLLWGSIRVVAEGGDESVLAAQTLEHLMRTLAPRRAALVATEDDRRRLLHGVRRGEERELLPLEESELGDAEHSLIRKAEADRSGAISSAGPGPLRAAFPLNVDDRSLGCLFLEFDETSKPLDSSDAFFLDALASQLAVAMDRARLAAREDARREQEKARLEAELSQLRDALGEDQLIYRSAEMEELLATIRRVAPTDATVLIEGESGTGKELLARAIHELSPRARREMVVVDCGSIPPTLVESELFGHERGAYTGAEQRRVGRLPEANGSTLFLDEIGELPLEVQAKLLRFVQERQYTPVGGNQAKSVDVRIVVATNRDLAAEVAAGRFREDLYYRLRVVGVDAPPLRNRPDDIVYLAHHFLSRYALLYKKAARLLSPESEALLLQHRWPGNVRELQNRIMQAVILSETVELTPEDLQLGEKARKTGPRSGRLPLEIPEAAPSARLPHSVSTPPSFASNPSSFASNPPSFDSFSSGSEADGPRPVHEDPWQALSTVLDQELASALGGNGAVLPPLGKWLGEDLLLAADERTGGNARSVSVLLSIPETTLRRRLSKAKDLRTAGLAVRSGLWPEAQDLLLRIVDAPDAGAAYDRCQRLLLELILERGDVSKKHGAALMGVTTPTYQRRLSEATGSSGASAGPSTTEAPS